MRARAAWVAFEPAGSRRSWKPALRCDLVPATIETLSIYALKSRFQNLLRPLVRGLYRIGVTANQVTLFACAVSIGVAALMILGPRICFVALPVWMFVRMALNAIDGMLAREFGQRSSLGAYLNELTDVVSDAALYLPFAFVTPFGWMAIAAAIFLSALTEMTGVVSVMTGASRRYDGPMGKSDRAFVFSLLALWIALARALPDWAVWIVWVIALLAGITVVNRIRGGLRELSGSPGRSPS